jgi:hypothetical protein
MAKKVPAPYTVKRFLGLIRNNLSDRQQRELRDELNRRMGEPITASDMLLDWEIIQKQALADELKFTWAALAEKEDILNAALKEVQNRIIKKRMCKARIETAEAYLELRKKHPKQITARHALLNLPKERLKEYAKKYLDDRDDERLRDYIAGVMETYERHTSRVKLRDYIEGIIRERK